MRLWVSMTRSGELVSLMGCWIGEDNFQKETPARKFREKYKMLAETVILKMNTKMKKLW